MKASNLRICAIAAALLPMAAVANSFASVSVVTKIVLTSCNSGGVFDGVDWWDTIGANGTYNLGVYQNLSSLRGATDTVPGAAVNFSISSGTSTYEVAASPGADRTLFDIQLFFDNSTTPQLSGIGALNQANGAVVINPAVGALAFNSADGNTYTLTNFAYFTPTNKNLDLVGNFINGSDGTKDYIGTFTVNSTPTVGQAVPEPASLGLLGLGAVALLRRRKR